MAEHYVGVKFEVRHLAPEPVEDPRISKLIGVGKVLAERGFCPENSGNLSFRSGHDFVITAAGSELGKLTPASFVRVKEVNVAQKIVTCTGNVRPSSEAIMHRMIYDARPEIQVVLHAHALNLKRAVTTSREYPYGTVEFARSAVEALRCHDLVILKNHGFVSVGKTATEAFQLIG